MTTLGEIIISQNLTIGEFNIACFFVQNTEGLPIVTTASVGMKHKANNSPISELLKYSLFLIFPKKNFEFQANNNNNNL